MVVLVVVGRVVSGFHRNHCRISKILAKLFGVTSGQLAALQVS